MSTTCELTGDVIRRGDPRYDAARSEFNARFDYYPEAVVFCRDAEDVRNGVCWARAHNVPIRLRSGRHSYEGYSVADGAVVIDVSRIHYIDVAADRKTAEIGAGAKLLSIYQTLWNHRVTIPGGSCPTVGVAGLTLGGGFGLLGREFGVTCDSLEAVQVVLADQRVVWASRDEQPDLFWACQGGGGGNFGVVTAFRFKVWPIDNVVIYNLTWDWDAALFAKILAYWQEWAPPVDPRLTAILKCSAKSSGTFATIGQFNGPHAELVKLIAPQLAMGTPKVSIQTVPFIEAVYYFGGVKEPEHPERYAHWLVHEAARKTATPQSFKNTSAYVYKPLPSQAVKILIEMLEQTPNPQALAQFDAYGGAVARVPVEATAFYHRDALFNIQYQTYWTDPVDERPNIRCVETLRNRLLPFTTGGYVNYIDRDVANYLDFYYSKNLKRLEKTKQLYDPTNIFRFPQSIPGAPITPRVPLRKRPVARA